jgi:hypothetical protein
MPLAASQRRFLIVEQSVVPFGVNFLLNGAIAWATFRAAVSVPFAGQSSIVGDTLVTSFLLPLLTCLIVTVLLQKQLAAGKAPAFAEATRGVGGFLAARGKLARGALLGVAAVIAVGVPTLLVLSAVGVDTLARNSFLWFKATYAGGLAALVQPAIAWLALARRAL